jgi:glycosyltransferase involved in cell wall biosynthesis
LYLNLNQNIKISLVTPTFNSEKYLEETILSVINQNYPNLEYFIIDGGSTDGTIEIIKKYEKHISFWISEPDNGMYHAIQKGFDKSTGDLMAWLNSDDKYQPNALKMISQVFSDLDNIEWLIGMPAFYNKDGLCVKVSENRGWSKTRFWIRDYRWIQQESVFWRRSLWEKAGGHIVCSYKYAGDFELWCRFFNHAQLFNVTAPFAGFRLHGDQISLNYPDIYESEVLEILRSFKPGLNDRKRCNRILRLWNLSNYLTRLNYKVFKGIGLTLSYTVDKMHNFPPQVYYDFGENKWKIN